MTILLILAGWFLLGLLLAFIVGPMIRGPRDY